MHRAEFCRSYFIAANYTFLGPENWHKNFPVAASEHQSPINIDTHDLIHDPYLSEINLNGYNTTDSALNYHLRNTGYSVKVHHFVYFFIYFFIQS